MEDRMASGIAFLTQGDMLPSVTTSQILLRRHRPGARISADGIYGPLTGKAVQAFQSLHVLKVDGIIGPQTWGSLMQVSGLKTLHVVDGTDPSLVALEAADISGIGEKPIVVYGMSNGIDFVMGRIVGRAAPGAAGLLCFHGHGNRGMQNVTGGEIYGAPHLAGISDDNFEQVQPSLARLRPIFAGFGSVQLQGCLVGGGPQGRSLLNKLSLTWGVPVTAGTHTQFGGGQGTFRFTGPTATGFPLGNNLRGWSQEIESRFGNTTMPT
jgi:Putative peptidoglycan binding domain